MTGPPPAVSTVSASADKSLTLAFGALLWVSGYSWWMCPYSKVEESFNLQATHDLFYYGIMGVGAKEEEPPPPHDYYQHYDHLQYPGVVPRTFTGPVVLVGACRILQSAAWMWTLGYYHLEEHAEVVQAVARFVLLVLTAQQWLSLARALEQRSTSSSSSYSYYKYTGTYLLLIAACQFHLTYYMSRMLPNCFATVLTLRCYAQWMWGGGDNMRNAAISLVLAAAIFRCDLILLLLTVGLSWLVTRQLTVRRALRIGIVTVIVGGLVTVPLDSYLWQRPLLWPELQVLYFNVVLNKSSEWGVQPWHWYFTRAIPYAMLFTIVLVPLSFLRLPEVLSAWELRIRNNQRKNKSRPSHNSPLAPLPPLLDTTWLPFLIPALGFVVLYSFLGHKETRFLFPVLPLWNVAAAVGASRIHSVAFPVKDKSPTVMARVAFAGLVLCLIGTLVGTLVFVNVSRHNYPGGEALDYLVRHVENQVATIPDFNNLAVNHHNTPSPSSSSSTPLLLQAHVYIDVAAAMSGVSLFGQRAAQQRTAGTVQWNFVKEGYEPENAVSSGSSDNNNNNNNRPSSWSHFTHLVTEQANREESKLFRLVATAQSLTRPSLFSRQWRDAMYVFERDGWIQTQQQQEQQQQQKETIPSAYS